ncbi:MAG: HAD-IA family hydrolase [Candidatus Niameybacter stercoravium]|nr:HAD-IA family hydrolase [Candidatus Niameybacter stercoravium]
MKQIKNILFDYDGTLHNNLKIYIPAFKKAYGYLVEKGYANHRVWKDDEISKWVGYNSKEMWNLFMKDLPDLEKVKCSRIIGSEMIHLLNEQKAELYEGTLEVLGRLKNKGYRLLFLSNCKIEYMNAHRVLFNLDQYFEGFYCTEAFGYKPKYEIFNRINETYRGEFIVVGDREVDIEIALKHNLKSIGCAYGFGRQEELAHAKHIAYSIEEVETIIERYDC